MTTTEELYGITIDYSRDTIITDFACNLLEQFYMKEGETSPQQAFARASTAYACGDMAFAQRIYDYASRGWFMFSTPVLSNAIAPNGKWKGMPVSCFLTYVNDSLEGLIDHTSEIRWLSVKGGGTAGAWSAIRAVSAKAPGPIPFLKTIDADMSAYSQGVTRRGSYAAYLDISHPDVVEFIHFRTPTGGDSSRKAFNIHNALNITDEFMNSVLEDKEWHLLDPNDGSIRDTLSARKLWQDILEVRSKTGEPYLHFIDTSNAALPQPLKDLNLRINCSNLCSEIVQPTSVDRTAVCCLLSVVCDHYEEWKHTGMIQDLIRLLDNVLEIFIQHAPPTLAKAIHGATRERSLGLGVMGFHSYLQSKSVPFESAMAKVLNKQIFHTINQEAIASSMQLAIERGEYPDGIGSGRRNAHLIAVAPNANTSIIANTSPSIEPTASNAYVHKTRAGAHLVKNKHLEALFNTPRFKHLNTEELWTDIITSQGSVQHLDCLTEHEKLVFKTAFELNQLWLISHAADRQPYICQAQSLNLFFKEGATRDYVNKVHIEAWRQKLKSLYYVRTALSFIADKVSISVERHHLQDHIETSNQDEECLSCHS